MIQRALVFDGGEIKHFPAIVQTSIQKAGWESILFTNAAEALENFDPNHIDALVTSVGGRPNQWARYYLGEAVIEESDDLELPRAVISKGVGALFVRKGDLYLPVNGLDLHDTIERTTKELTSWLGKLTEPATIATIAA